MISFRRNQGIRFCARFLSEFSEFFGRAAVAIPLSFFLEKETLVGICLMLKFLNLPLPPPEAFF